MGEAKKEMLREYVDTVAKSATRYTDAVVGAMEEYRIETINKLKRSVSTAAMLTALSNRFRPIPPLPEGWKENETKINQMLGVGIIIVNPGNEPRVLNEDTWTWESVKWNSEVKV